MENKKNENQIPEFRDEQLDAVAGGQGDPDLIWLEFYSEVDRICRERGIHPTDKWRVSEVEEEVKRKMNL